MARAVLQCDMVSFAGVAPTLIYLKEEDRVLSLTGWVTGRPPPMSRR